MLNIECNCYPLTKIVFDIVKAFGDGFLSLKRSVSIVLNRAFILQEDAIS